MSPKWTGAPALQTTKKAWAWQQVPRPEAGMGLASLRTKGKASMASDPWGREWPKMRSERSTGPYCKG